MITIESFLRRVKYFLTNHCAKCWHNMQPSALTSNSPS